MKVDFYQIIYEDIQAEQCYTFATLYKNETLTDYFENSVIANIIHNRDTEKYYTSICSWQLKRKRGDMFRLIDKSLTLEKITSIDYDVAVLTPRSPSHKPLAMAAHWHYPAWDQAFEVFKKFLKTDLNINVPNELTTAIYENHFIARTDIYKDYVKTCLIPAMAHMDKHEVYKTEAGYVKRKTVGECIKVKEKLGHYWTIAPFILERLFSIYCEGKGFKIINL
jgi:hypothetical protein